MRGVVRSILKRESFKSPGRVTLTLSCGHVKSYKWSQQPELFARCTECRPGDTETTNPELEIAFRKYIDDNVDDEDSLAIEECWAHFHAGWSAAIARAEDT